MGGSMRVFNPFKIRFSENIVSDSNFLSLFESRALDLLPENGLWDRVQIFRSAPGGGKTSIFKIFTPDVLHTLYNLDTKKASFDELISKCKIQKLKRGNHVPGRKKKNLGYGYAIRCIKD